MHSEHQQTPQATLHGARVTLRPARETDIPALVAIRSDPEVYRWWRGGPDLAATVAEELADPDAHCLTICLNEPGMPEGRIVGFVQWFAEEEPDYRHASIDIYLDTAFHGRGLGTDATYTLARHLIADHGHHRITIDPAANNYAAIRCYSKVGFRPVGVMRRYERGADGTWHDGLLMDLLADELTRETETDTEERTS
jgi:aminoglycoside 6'-N-acetyltransferase